MSLTLEARRRVGTGKGAGRRIRAMGMIPAVLYGGSAGPVNLAVQPKDIKNIMSSARGANATFELRVDGGETVGLVRIADFQKDPVRRTLVHCDLQRLDPAAKRQYKVPVKLDGVGPAQKMGAKLRFVTREVVLECVPQVVPTEVTVSLNELEPGGIIRLSDVAPPEGTQILFRDNAPIVVAGTAGGAAEG